MKTHTDKEQSRRLSEILRHESADLVWYRDAVTTEVNPRIMNYAQIPELQSMYYSPCWSLAALLEQIPSDIKTKEGCNYTLEIEKCDAEPFPCGLNYHDTWGRGEDIITHYYDNFVDACYEMILKLHEQKLL